MLKAIDTENPPLRLVLRQDAVEGFRRKLSNVEQNLDDWEQVSLSTAFSET